VTVYGLSMGKTGRENAGTIDRDRSNQQFVINRTPRGTYAIVLAEARGRTSTLTPRLTL